jgi:hypothetical protein
MRLRSLLALALEGQHLAEECQLPEAPEKFATSPKRHVTARIRVNKALYE